MGDKHLNTIPETESDEFIKSSVEDLVPIPSESEGIPDKMCDVPLCENTTSLNALNEHSEIVVDSNDDNSSSDDDSPYGEDIEYVDAHSPRKEISSGIPTTHSDLSLPNYKAFYVDNDHFKEKSSGSTITHVDFSQYDSFIFDLSINPFSSYDRSDLNHEEFADELAHIISPPEYDHFCFKVEPELGNLTMDVVNDIFPTREPRVHVPNVLPTHPTLDTDFILFTCTSLRFLYCMDFSSLFSPYPVCSSISSLIQDRKIPF
ncbi:hypothetical protein Tco_0926681 [Tanacetum coccineum]|uniref:Reverse transcriptase domain-containing protein n=1 Tax=Tanacetum coccineum TaxID=301880 RepID=A0ABQ5DBM9_9ASTR